MIFILQTLYIIALLFAVAWLPIQQYRAKKRAFGLTLAALNLAMLYGLFAYASRDMQPDDKGGIVITLILTYPLVIIVADTAAILIYKLGEKTLHKKEATRR